MKYFNYFNKNDSNIDDDDNDDDNNDSDNNDNNNDLNKSKSSRSPLPSNREETITLSKSNNTYNAGRRPPSLLRTPPSELTLNTTVSSSKFKRPPLPRKQTGTAIYEYTAEADDELSFNPGDRIEVESKNSTGVNDGWWKGKNLKTGQIG
eukprot:Pgem_evm1s12536